MKLFSFIALAVLWPVCYSFAQDLRPEITHRLSIGDTVPDIPLTLWNGKPPAKLSDFAGKLVILDFWATWCGSCIRMFPKSDSIQNRYAGQVVFLLVNSIRSTQDSSRQLKNFFQRWETKNGKPFPLHTVYNDTTAYKLFPHIFLPHYVWISGGRKVLAITGSDAITTTNIRKALMGRTLKEPIKGDRYDKDN